MGRVGARDVLRLKDVATIRAGYLEPPITQMRFNGQPALAIQLANVAGGNILDTGRAIEQRLAGPYVLLLRAGGSCVYFGKVGDHYADVLGYFRTVRGVVRTRARGFPMDRRHHVMIALAHTHTRHTHARARSHVRAHSCSADTSAARSATRPISCLTSARLPAATSTWPLTSTRHVMIASPRPRPPDGRLTAPSVISSIHPSQAVTNVIGYPCHSTKNIVIGKHHAPIAAGQKPTPTLRRKKK